MPALLPPPETLSSVGGPSLALQLSNTRSVSEQMRDTVTYQHGGIGEQL